jgi:hypothetical protein
MTWSERQRRNALTLLISTRERNDDATRGLEAERGRVLAHGGLIPPHPWSRRGPTPTKPGATSPDRGQGGYSVGHDLGPVG